MEIVTVGRDSSNTIVVNDNFVGRWHLELIYDEQNNCTLRDLQSKNGTYINGNKVTNEVLLRPNDIVRIGNTIVPWQTKMAPISIETKSSSPSIWKKIKWRTIFTVFTSIISFLFMILMLLRYLK